MALSMSSLGQCILASVAEAQGRIALLGERERQATLLVMREGQRHEAWIAEDLKERGFEVSLPAQCAQCARQGYHVTLPLPPRYELVGHIDRYAVVDGRRFVLEIKSMGESAFARWRRHGLAGFPRYAYQVSAYMHATGLPAVLAVKNRSTGVLDTVVVEAPPVSLDAIRERVETIYAHIQAGTLPDCDAPEERCGYCHFALAPDRAEPNPAIAEALERFHALRQIVKRAEDEMAEVHEMVKNYMLKYGSNRFTHKGIIATIVRPRPIVRVDVERLREGYPDVFVQVAYTEEREPYLTIRTPET